MDLNQKLLTELQRVREQHLEAHKKIREQQDKLVRIPSIDFLLDNYLMPAYAEGILHVETCSEKDCDPQLFLGTLMSVLFASSFYTGYELGRLGQEITVLPPPEAN